MKAQGTCIKPCPETAEPAMTFDKTIKMYDEPHTPLVLDRVSANGTLNRGKFLTPAHQDSYRLQMQEMKTLGVSRVLEIGPGEGFIANYMRTLGVFYDTMDITPNSHPTILGKLEDFDPSNHRERFDMVCAFQMLEHSPYECFVPNLRKMTEMSRQYVYISLPYSCVGFKFSLSFMLGQTKQWRKTFSFYWPLNNPNRKHREEYIKQYPWAVHYWEIGRKGFPLSRIKNDIQSVGLNILKTFHSDNPYHFFILASKKTSSERT